MARFEVTVASRDESVTATRFVVDTNRDEQAFKYGTSPEEIANVTASEFCDSGSIVVRRMGGGERFVLGRS